MNRWATNLIKISENCLTSRHMVMNDFKLDVCVQCVHVYSLRAPPTTVLGRQRHISSMNIIHSERVRAPIGIDCVYKHYRWRNNNRWRTKPNQIHRTNESNLPHFAIQILRPIYAPHLFFCFFVLVRSLVRSAPVWQPLPSYGRRVFSAADGLVVAHSERKSG